MVELAVEHAESCWLACLQLLLLRGQGDLDVRDIVRSRLLRRGLRARTRVLWVEDMATALPEPEMTASILWGRLFAATAPDILETRGTVVSDSLVVLSLHQGEAV